MLVAWCSSEADYKVTMNAQSQVSTQPPPGLSYNREAQLHTSPDH